MYKYPMPVSLNCIRVVVKAGYFTSINIMKLD